MNLEAHRLTWEDVENYHRHINDSFTELVNTTHELKAHRDWVEANVFGFGERSFHWLHKLIVDEMPEEFKFLEIGIFRGQVLSLYKLLADQQGKKVERYGVSPLDSSGGHWPSDYEQDVKTIHDQFNLAKDYTIFKGLSTEPLIISASILANPYDIVYIDGGHDKATVQQDLFNYTPLVKTGGYLLIDDACCDMKQPWGYFQGISDVTEATLEYMNGNPEWEFVMNVVHNRLYRKL